jgi:hypothetical protein
VNEKQQEIARKLLDIFEEAHIDCQYDRAEEAEERGKLLPRRCEVCELLHQWYVADDGHVEPRKPDPADKSMASILPADPRECEEEDDRDGDLGSYSDFGDS